MQIPRIISVDDHVLEPPTLWTERLPKKYLDRCPRVERKKGAYVRDINGWIDGADTPDAAWADLWLYDDMLWPLIRGYAQSGYEDDDALHAITYDDVLPSTWSVMLASSTWIATTLMSRCVIHRLLGSADRYSSSGGQRAFAPGPEGI